MALVWRCFVCGEFGTEDRPLWLSGRWLTLTGLTGESMSHPEYLRYAMAEKISPLGDTPVVWR